MKMIFQQISSPTDSSFILKEYYQPQFTAPLHFHHAYELIYIVKSFGKFYGENRIMNFQEGDIYLFGPEFAHCFYNDQAFIDTGEMAHSLVVQFNDDFLGKDFFKKPELRKIQKTLDASRLGIKITEPDVRLHSLFMKLKTAKNMEALLTLLHLLDLLSVQKNHKISFITLRKEKNINNERDSEKMELIVKYIMDNFRDSVCIKEAASIACLNEAAFCRYFKRRTKKTFSQFVNDVRIAHATYLLSKQSVSIAEVCYSCGYNNISYFNRQFQILVGKTPLKYRKELPEECLAL
jgi:YesN/AraC family two-component response regulator